MDQLDGWLNFSTLEIGRHRPLAKRAHVSSSLTGHQQTHQLQGQRHDGRSIPKKLYGYWRLGKTLEPASHKRARHTTKQLRQHLRILHAQMDGAYKSMNPFPSSTTSEETPVIAVQLEHGLVYRVLFHSTYQYSALMYTFYTPLDFLEYPYTKTVSV
jgi:hypothetical protein